MFNVSFITHYRVPNRDFADFSINFYRVDDRMFGGCHGMVWWVCMYVGVTIYLPTYQVYTVSALTTNYLLITIGWQLNSQKNAVNSLVFPGGPPAQYWPGLTSLRGGVRMGSCSFDVVWSTANIYRTIFLLPKVHYRVANQKTSPYFHFELTSIWILPYIFCTYVEH